MEHRESIPSFIISQFQSRHFPRRLSSPVLAPQTDLFGFEDRFLNSGISNKVERPFLEREAVVQSVVKQRRSKGTGPTSPRFWPCGARSASKTSLIQHLVLKVRSFAASRRCRQRFVIRQGFQQHWCANKTQTLVSEIILWHLSDGHSVKLSPRQVVKFKRSKLMNLMELHGSQSTTASFSFRTCFQAGCQTVTESSSSGIW